jgi:hypothetical protein
MLDVKLYIIFFDVRLEIIFPGILKRLVSDPFLIIVTSLFRLSHKHLIELRIALLNIREESCHVIDLALILQRSTGCIVQLVPTCTTQCLLKQFQRLLFAFSVKPCR